MTLIRPFKLLRPDQTIATACKRLENSTAAEPGIPGFSGSTLRRKKRPAKAGLQKGALTQDATYKNANQAVLV
jgi:hypothetical protein